MAFLHRREDTVSGLLREEAGGVLTLVAAQQKAKTSFQNAVGEKPGQGGLRTSIMRSSGMDVEGQLFSEQELYCTLQSQP